MICTQDTRLSFGYAGGEIILDNFVSRPVILLPQHNTNRLVCQVKYIIPTSGYAMLKTAVGLWKLSRKQDLRVHSSTTFLGG